MARNYKFGQKPRKIGVILTQENYEKLVYLSSFKENDKSRTINELIEKAGVSISSGVTVQQKPSDLRQKTYSEILRAKRGGRPLNETKVPKDIMGS